MDTVTSIFFLFGNAHTGGNRIPDYCYGKNRRQERTITHSGGANTAGTRYGSPRIVASTRTMARYGFMAGMPFLFCRERGRSRRAGPGEARQYGVVARRFLVAALAPEGSLPKRASQSETSCMVPSASKPGDCLSRVLVSGRSRRARRSGRSSGRSAAIRPGACWTEAMAKFMASAERRVLNRMSRMPASAKRWKLSVNYAVRPLFFRNRHDYQGSARKTSWPSRACGRPWAYSSTWTRAGPSPWVSFGQPSQQSDYPSRSRVMEQASYPSTKHCQKMPCPG